MSLTRVIKVYPICMLFTPIDGNESLCYFLTSLVNIVFGLKKRVWRKYHDIILVGFQLLDQTHATERGLKFNFTTECSEIIKDF